MTPRRTFLSGLFAAVLLVTLGGQSARAEDFGKEAETFVQKMADSAIQFVVLKNATQEERYAKFRTLLNDSFDVNAIGKWVLGRYWRKATEAQQDEYLKLFEDLIVITYADRFVEYSDVGVKVIESVSQNGDDAIVRSQVALPGAKDAKPVRVDWRVKGKNGVLKVVDVVVEGISMSQTQRSEFTSVIKRDNDDVAGLLKALQEKTAALRAPKSN